MTSPPEQPESPQEDPGNAAQDPERTEQQSTNGGQAAGDREDNQERAQAERESGTEEESGTEGTPHDGAERVAENEDDREPGDVSASEGRPEAEQASEAEQAPAKKRRTGLIAGVAAAAVVVLVGGGVGAFFVFFGGDSAKEVAERYVAVATRETQNPRSVTAADYKPIVCRKSMPQIEKMQKRKEQVLKQVSPADMQRVKQVKTSLKKVDTKGDTGTATFETSFPGQPPQSARLQLIKEDGGWQLCG